MNGPQPSPSAAARYDRALKWARESRLPKDSPRPLPSSAWPLENVALLERYRDWLIGGGASQAVVDVIYLPMAGHVLGLSLKPHDQLDLTTDLDKAMDYLEAKKRSVQWTDNCRNALEKFRTFLKQERGILDVRLPPVSYARHCEGLPDWLISEMERYQQLMQRNWRPRRLVEQTRNFWSTHTRLWRYLFARYPIRDIGEIKRGHLLDYVGHMLGAGYATSSVNADLRYFRAFLLFLQDREYLVPQSLLRVPSVRQPDSLPRFLTDDEVRLLRDDLEGRFGQAGSHRDKRDAALDRAAFYLMWHGALRLGEVEELHLEDLDLTARRLIVRRGKGAKDRPVYLTDRTLQVLRDYLALRGSGSTSHLFLYRNQPVHKDLLGSRIRASGQRVGVHVYPHRLRHTCATQLLNAGCRVTSIQKLLGHRKLNSTMTYARVHDSTVAEDYYAAMARVEGRLEPLPTADSVSGAVDDDQRAMITELMARLAERDLDHEARLDTLAKMRSVLDHLLDRHLAGAVISATSGETEASSAGEQLAEG